MLYQDRSWLCEQYWTNELSPRLISQLCGKAPTTIHRWLGLLGIPKRTMSKAASLRCPNHVNITKPTMDILTGHLLGDGGITAQSQYSAKLQQSCAQKSYLEFISSQLQTFGIERSGKINETKIRTKDTMYTAWHYGSLNYVELRSVYDSWYKEGKKCLPLHLSLNRATCLYWFLDDGSLQKYCS